MRLSPASGAKVEVSRRDDIVVRVHDESGMSRSKAASRQGGSTVCSLFVRARVDTHSCRS